MHKKQISQSELLPAIKEAFSHTPLSTRKAVKAVNNLLMYITNHNLPQEYYKNIFFHILRGLSTEDPYLKSFLYSTLMQMAKNTTDSFLAISSLTRDLNSDSQHILKAKALKTLFVLVPQQMVNDFEKYVSQGFVSRFEPRKDAAVLASLLFVQKNKENVKRWVMNLKIIQNVPVKDFHAYALLSQIKDRKSIESFFENFNSFKGAAGIFLINLLYQINKKNTEKYRSLITNLLKSNDEMIIIETCRIISKMDDISSYIKLITVVLSPLLRSTKKIVKFSAMRVVSSLSISCNQINLLNKEIEDLVGNKNRVLSMMAITTLLNTGTEETVERLVETLPDIINDMSDGFKIVVISALESLSLKFKSKESVFLEFIQKSMNDKGSIDFKRYLISVISRLANEKKYSDKMLDILSIYIEDSQDHILTMDILAILGNIVGKSKNPYKYLVHIFNRLILDNTYVRCAALQSLFSICNDLPQIKEKIDKIYMKCLSDDDELVSEECKFLLNYNESSNENIYNLMPKELKEKVFFYLGEEMIESEEIVKKSNFIKETREIALTEKNDDFNLYLKKSVYSDKIILNFRIENILENIGIKSGKINLIVKGNNFKEKVGIEIDSFEGEKSFERIILIDNEENNYEIFENEELLIQNKIKISLTDDLVLNGKFTYELCVNEDFEDVEIESLNLVPFSINYFDFIKPEIISENLIHKNNFKMKMNLKDLNSVRNKFKEIFNMKIVKEESGDGFFLVLNGIFEDEKIIVEVNCDKKLVCDVLVKCSSEMILENIVGRLCG
ncbi:coatomer subunit gamma [Gurleya vavrai]